MISPEKLEVAKLFVSILGFGGAIAALLFGLFQYRRGESWKRGEFIAKEMKEFESDPAVRNALSMIDWGSRKINLFLKSNPEEADYVKITRETQWKALLPHSLKPEYLAFDTKHQNLFTDQSNDTHVTSKFTQVEARIRDTYDVFLYYFVRFGNFIKTGLVKPEEIEPYLIYWLESIAGEKEDKDDILWQCALITFINYYDYNTVKYLFQKFGYDLEPNGEVYKQLKSLVTDQVYFEKLHECVLKKSKSLTSVQP